MTEPDTVMPQTIDGAIASARIDGDTLYVRYFYASQSYKFQIDLPTHLLDNFQGTLILAKHISLSIPQSLGDPDLVKMRITLSDISGNDIRLPIKIDDN